MIAFIYFNWLLQVFTFIIGRYLSNLQVLFALKGFMTGWQQLEVIITMQCSRSPIPFVAAIKIIPIGTRQVDRALKIPPWERRPALICYMDDVTIILWTAKCTTRLLKLLDKLTLWTRMKLRPSKSCSFSIGKELRGGRAFFCIIVKVTNLVEQPI